MLVWWRGFAAGVTPVRTYGQGLNVREKAMSAIRHWRLWFINRIGVFVLTGSRDIMRDFV